MRASRTFDFPDPLGPTMLVKLRKGPVNVSYSKNYECNHTKRFKVFDDQAIKPGKFGEINKFGWHVTSVDLGHDEILGTQHESLKSFVKIVFK
jgi:hypothetical protein